jgi:hypothetical protein
MSSYRVKLLKTQMVSVRLKDHRKACLAFDRLAPDPRSAVGQVAAQSRICRYQRCRDSVMDRRRLCRGNIGGPFESYELYFSVTLRLLPLRGRGHLPTSPAEKSARGIVGDNRAGEENERTGKHDSQIRPCDLAVKGETNQFCRVGERIELTDIIEKRT